MTYSQHLTIAWALVILSTGGCTAGSMDASTVTGTTAEDTDADGTPDGAANPNMTSPTAEGGSGEAGGTGGTGGTGKTCAQGWYRPAKGATWVWDLDNSSVPSPSVTAGGITFSPQIYDVDLFNTSVAQIAAYHQAGKKVICYLDAGSWESGRSDSGDFDTNCYCGPGVATNAQGACTGTGANTHKMDGWPEWWFDLHTPACIASVRSVLQKRIALAKSKGCDAIEPDNLDAWQNNTGWATTIADQNNFVSFLANAAHAQCMGAMLKNAGELLVGGNGNPTAYGPGLTQLFDGVVNEQCVQYNECDAYAGFLAANKPVFNAEYGASPNSAKCASGGIMTLQYRNTSVSYTNINQVCWPH